MRKKKLLLIKKKEISLIFFLLKLKTYQVSKQLSKKNTPFKYRQYKKQETTYNL